MRRFWGVVYVFVYVYQTHPGSEDEYELTAEDKDKIQKRVSKFRKETGTKYGIVPTLLTTYGLKPGINSGAVKRTITMFDLFK